MANQRSTFAKRQREQNKKDKSKSKQERLAARRDGQPDTGQKGPPMGEPQIIEPAPMPPLPGTAGDVTDAVASPSPSPSASPSASPSSPSSSQAPRPPTASRPSSG
jgi:hypothetical protein